MSNVYILSGGPEYENPSVLKVFERKQDADELKVKCEDHASREPDYPAMADPERKEKIKAYLLWETVNPLGTGSDTCCYYSVDEYKLEKEIKE